MATQSSSNQLLRKALADAIGTFALVFAGCGAAVVDAQTQALGHIGVSAVFGLVVGVMIFATGHISGAHFNPAVTLAMTIFQTSALENEGGYLTHYFYAYFLGPVFGGAFAGLFARYHNPLHRAA